MKQLYVVGIGPGEYEQLTIKAVNALNQSDIIIGYTVYVDLVREHFKDKVFLTTPMKKEVDRCEMAFEEAQKDQVVSLICSGDAGIYGMSGLIYELKEKYKEVTVTVISGITAASSGASLLGAPLMHDFAVISLSDLLTPWEKIEKRLLASAKADFCLCLYNPSSKKRHDYLEKACDLLLTYKKDTTICGIAQNIGRENEEYQVMTLKELKELKVDMFTTVFIGNSETKAIDGKMVTPRGYHIPNNQF